MIRGGTRGSVEAIETPATRAAELSQAPKQYAPPALLVFAERLVLLISIILMRKSGGEKDLPPLRHSAATACISSLCGASGTVLPCTQAWSLAR